MNSDEDEGIPQRAVPNGIDQCRGRGKIRRAASVLLGLLDGIDLLVGAVLGIAIVLMTMLDQWDRSPAIAILLLALLLWRVWKATRHGVGE